MDFDSLTPIFRTRVDSNIVISNSLFGEIQRQIITCIGCASLKIYNSTFKNILLTAYSFINFIGSSFADNTYSVIIQNSSFINISIPQSILFVQSSQLLLQNVLMYNITRLTNVISDNISYIKNFPLGVCCASDDDTIIDVQNSTFMNIDSHCFVLKKTILRVQYSTFNNTGLKSTEVNLTTNTIKGLDEYSGVTWIHVDDTSAIGPSTQFVLSHNRFINNMRRPLYGGVPFLIHPFP